MTPVWVTLAGSAGAVTRFLVDGAIRARWPHRWPWATFWINVSGSALLGLLTGLVMFAGVPEVTRVIVGVGFCGGYTTFGTASFETARLLQQDRRWPAVAYAAGSLLAATVAAGLGLLAAAAL